MRYVQGEILRGVGNGGGSKGSGVPAACHLHHCSPYLRMISCSLRSYATSSCLGLFRSPQDLHLSCRHPRFRLNRCEQISQIPRVRWMECWSPWIGQSPSRLFRSRAKGHLKRVVFVSEVRRGKANGATSQFSHSNKIWQERLRKQAERGGDVE